jgi:hypothetical protein
MRRLLVPVAILVPLVLAGCGGGGSASPKAAFESVKQALVEKDFKTLWALLSADSQQLIDEDAKLIREAAAKAEGPADTALAEQARLIDMKLSELKTVDGEGLFIATLKMATAVEEKNYWDKLSHMELVSIDEKEIEQNRVEVKVKVGEAEQTLPFVKEGADWKLNIARDYQGTKGAMEQKADELKKAGEGAGNKEATKDAGKTDDKGKKE